MARRFLFWLLLTLPYNSIQYEVIAHQEHRDPQS